jgi:hypothetical protein
VSDSTKSAIENMTGNLMIFIVLIVGIYVAVSLFVHKTPAFSKFSRNTRNAIISVTLVFVFGLIGYYFSGAVIAAI